MHPTHDGGWYPTPVAKALAETLAKALAKAVVKASAKTLRRCVNKEQATLFYSKTGFNV